MSFEIEHVQGPEEAPIHLIEYGDYQCPFCGRAYGVIKRLQQIFGNDLRFTFRNFPLGIQHPHAMDAARAAEAAAAQGKFWEMHDLLYENQQNLSLERILELTTKLGLDRNKFTADMASDNVIEKIERDLYEGARKGVNGTPSFFINGKHYLGDWSYPAMLETLTALRKKKLAA